jgi:hypothetical protein
MQLPLRILTKAMVCIVPELTGTFVLAVSGDSLNVRLLLVAWVSGRYQVEVDPPLSVSRSEPWMMGMDADW